MKLEVEKSLPYVESLNDSLNFGRYSDDLSKIKRCFNNLPKIGCCFDNLCEIERCSCVPLESSKQKLRKSKRKKVAINFGNDFVFLAENNPQNYVEIISSFDTLF